MAIELLGFPTTLGLPRTARRHGPEALRQAGILQELKDLGAQLNDLGDLSLDSGDVADSPERRVEKVVRAARAQADLWQRSHRPGDLMLTLGGDHSTSLGTIWALASMGHTFDVVWIDAHGDFNVLETSPSGNPHGMVLSLACGLMPQFMPRTVAPSALRLWGIRDLDAGERKLLEQERVEVLTPDQTRLQRDRLVGRLKPNVLLSFDIDSVEPAEAPATMTPVPGGFTRTEALELVRMVASQRNILALDIVEVHPDLDRNQLTESLAVAVAKVAVAEQLKRRIPGANAVAGD